LRWEKATPCPFTQAPGSAAREGFHIPTGKDNLAPEQPGKDEFVNTLGMTAHWRLQIATNERAIGDVHKTRIPSPGSVANVTSGGEHVDRQA
jgi:hypothetical protein